MSQVAGRILLVVLFLMSAGGACAFQPVQVTLCSDADQAGAGTNLRTALIRGTKITFRCGGRVTIRVLQTLTIRRSTEIDGGGTVTLDSNLTARMFRVTAPSVTFRLFSISLKRGRPDHVVTGPNYTHMAGTAGGIVLSQAANTRLELERCTVQESEYPIELVSGLIWVRDTNFESNRSKVLMAPELDIVKGRLRLNAQAIPLWSFGGSSVIDQSEFSGNDGSVFRNCTLRVTRSNFTANTTATRGAALSIGCGNAAVENSEFVNNKALKGGAIYVTGAAVKVSLRALKLRGNVAQDVGGAVAFEASNTGARTLELRYITFEDNQAKTGGALDLGDFIQSTTGLDAAAVTFVRNVATKDGGAIHGQGVTARISRGIFSENRAGRNGGAILLATFNPRNTIIANTILVQNHAAMRGSALLGNSMTLINSTVADNDGLAMSLFAPFPASFYSIQLVNTVIAQNVGGNCSGGSGAASFFNGGNNLQFPGTSCGGTILSADPQLGGMYAPIAGSPAYAGGNLVVCGAPPISNKDVYGQRRQKNRFCTIGAVEGEVEERVKRMRGREPQDGNGYRLP